MTSGGQWPRWATVRADEVRTVLPPEEWGAWAQGGDCSRGTPAAWGLQDTGHPAERPFFFHCLSCIAAVYRGGPPPKPDSQRDKGLCIRCGEPAERLRDRVFTPSAACQQAEAKGITVARLSTRKFCASCDPSRLPWCMARRRNAACAGSKRHRAVVDCRHTRLAVDRHGHRQYNPHCAAECERVKAPHRQHPKHSLTVPPPVRSACQWCGLPLTGNPMKKYCSRAHGKAFRHNQRHSLTVPPPVRSACQWCGLPLTGNPMKKYCSDAHGKAFRHKKEKSA